MNPILSNRILLILSLAGAGVSLYLTLAHLSLADLGCSRIHGCEEVALHYTAKGFGIPFLKAVPTAAFGLLMYLTLAALCFMRAAAGTEERARLAGNLQWGLAALGVAVSAWLTYLEAYVIKAWCQWCVVSAVIILLIFVIAASERIGRAPMAQGEPT